MNNDKTEVFCKARLTENKNGKLIIQLEMDEYDLENAVLEYGTIPRGIVSKVIVTRHFSYAEAAMKEANAITSTE